MNNGPKQNNEANPAIPNVPVNHWLPSSQGGGMQAAIYQVLARYLPSNDIAHLCQVNKAFSINASATGQHLKDVLAARRQMGEIRHFQSAANNNKITLDEGMLKKLNTITERAFNAEDFENREAFLDEINASLIRSRIESSKTSLDISRMQLTRFPNALFQDKALESYWSKLETLYCYNNQLTVLPDSLGQCVKLKGLVCYNNKLTALPDKLGQCVKLEWLSCYNNQLTALPESLRQCIKLKMLSCYNNQLTALPDSLGLCVELGHLDCSNNQLTVLPDSLGQCVAFEWLYCFSNQLTALPDSLGQCAKLERLYCSDNQLTALPDSLGQCAKLESLSCSNNQLTALPKSLQGKNFVLGKQKPVVTPKITEKTSSSNKRVLKGDKKESLSLSFDTNETAQENENTNEKKKRRKK